MAEFTEGELAILQNATYFEEWDGAVAVVIGRLALRNPRNMHTLEVSPVMAYKVMPLVNDAFGVNCAPYQLRKLDAPESLEELEVGGEVVVLDAFGS